MVSEEAKNRQKVLKFGFLCIGGTYAIANWIITQMVAATCDYNPLLGAHLSFLGIHIYPPYGFYFWTEDPLLVKAIPHVLGSQTKWIYLAVLAAGVVTYLYNRSMRQTTSHGSASFANAKDIIAAGLGELDEKTKKPKTSGVVVGVNPYTGKLMLHNGVEHMLLMAPTRSGKGVNTIIPTGLVWAHSIFFFDVKSELWQATATYRRSKLHQKVLKFEPLCTDGSGARWNPLAEIDFRTNAELSDIQTIVSMLVKPDGEKKGGGDPFWDNAASACLTGVILHLLYSHYIEKKPLPCLTDILSFLSSPDKSTEELFEDMKTARHITEEEFMSDHNPLQEIYGEYIKDFRDINEELGCNCRTLDELKTVIREHGNIDFSDEHFNLLLTHPKVAESAANMVNNAEQTRASILSTAQTCLAIYQNPVVQENTAVSDFAIRDLLDPKQAVSLYLVMQVKDVATLKPLSRLFINTMLDKLIRDMKFEKDQKGGAVGKQRLLLMLDEFPQLGNLAKVEQALAVCAGYGIKMCIVSQDVNQLNKEYTKDNSIASNCHVHIYFTPNLDSGGATAKSISTSLGKKTITTINHSDGGGAIGKGSNSISSMGRELMTPDEVAKMSSEKELVFVAGQKPIFGDKFRYYKNEGFMKRVLPAPLYSDSCTKVATYEDLFQVHEADKQDRLQRQQLVLAAKKAAGLVESEDDNHEENEENGGTESPDVFTAGEKQSGSNSSEEIQTTKRSWDEDPVQVVEEEPVTVVEMDAEAVEEYTKETTSFSREDYAAMEKMKQHGQSFSAFREQYRQAEPQTGTGIDANEVAQLEAMKKRMARRKKKEPEDDG